MRLIFLLAASLTAYAPNLNPVSWTIRLEPKHLVLHASIDKDYRIYSPEKRTAGPIALRVKIVESEWVSAGKPIAPLHGDTLSGEVDIRVPYKLRKPLPGDGLTIHAEVQYQSCSDVICLPPVTRGLSIKLLAANSVF